MRAWEARAAVGVARAKGPGVGCGTSTAVGAAEAGGFGDGVAVGAAVFFSSFFLFYFSRCLSGMQVPWPRELNHALGLVGQRPDLTAASTLHNEIVYYRDPSSCSHLRTHRRRCRKLNFIRLTL